MARFFSSARLPVGAEAYRDRRRHLYMLLFRSGKVYVGQTVDLRRRLRQHIHQSGWRGPFRFHVIGSYWGTRAKGEDLEQIWRLWAHAQNHIVLGAPPNIVVDPRNRSSADQKRRAEKLRMPLSWKWSWLLPDPWHYPKSSLWFLRLGSFLWFFFAYALWWVCFSGLLVIIFSVLLRLK
jgi:hypothetical protein